VTLLNQHCFELILMTDKTEAFHTHTPLKALTEMESHPNPPHLGYTKPPHHSTQRVERVPSAIWDPTTFAVGLGGKAMVGMCVGMRNGTFVIAELVEALNRGMVEDEEGRKREVGGGFWERGG
jgi:hypothetical protein